ncbi:unnamed protein product [Cladocopium goreaui]|uniref:tRNA 2-selenouridine synthase n=1 Tax=Cladocopium goreaui TaxID=2562237 RepID=A0A9P1FV46_9DINO|nr:unnamed protein product [Cladocopium goreaui]
MADFPALPSPASEGVISLPIEALLDALDGPPQQGPRDLAELKPLLLTIDVRSPAEFEAGHIPGAVNVPLFDDEARALVGTDFKRKGRYEAESTGGV